MEDHQEAVMVAATATDQQPRGAGIDTRRNAIANATDTHIGCAAVSIAKRAALNRPSSDSGLVLQNDEESSTAKKWRPVDPACGPPTQ